MREPGGTKRAAGGSDSCLASTPTSEKFVSLFLQFRSIRQRSAHERTAGIIPPLTPNEFYSTLSRERTEAGNRSEEHTSELTSLMRISYAVFCLKKKQYNPINIYLTLYSNSKLSLIFVIHHS